MMKKTLSCACEGGAYPSSPGVKAGLHSEAYWLRLRPVWTDKAAVWSHLMTAPEGCRETFFFPCAFLRATTFTSATEAQTSCALLCACVSDLSGFQQLAGDRATEKESLWFAISRLRFHTILRPFCWFSANICFSLTVPGWPWHWASRHRRRTKGGCGKKGS